MESGEFESFFGRKAAGRSRGCDLGYDSKTISTQEMRRWRRCG